MIRLSNLLKNHKKLVCYNILLALLLIILLIPQPYYIKLIIDKVIIQGDMQIFKWLIAVILGVSILKFITSIIQNRVFAILVQRILVDLREKIYLRVHQIEYEHYVKIQKGDIITRLLDDVGIIGESLTVVVMSLWINVIVILAYSTIAIFLSWKLFVVSIICVPILVTISLTTSKFFKIKSTKFQESKSKLICDFEEELAGLKHIKLANAVDQRYKLFEKNILLIKTEFISWITLDSLIRNSNQLITSLGPTLLLLYGVTMVNSNNLTIGELLAFMGYLGLIYSPIMQLLDVIPQNQVLRASLDRINEIFNWPFTDSQKEKCNNLPSSGAIVFKDVSYSTNEGKVLFENINFEVKQGEVIRVSGISGVGKTTLINLIMGIVRPFSGNIMFDNVSLLNYLTPDISEKIVLVPQESYLFNGTIFENLTLGITNISLEEVIEKTKALGLHSDILEMENGYQTKIGGRGMNLSGGQQKRVMIARAILKKPSILILDESTSEIDTQMEKQIIEFLKNELTDSTLIIVTHKPVFSMKELNISNKSVLIGG